MKIKTSELEGAALDRAVAQCIGSEFFGEYDSEECCYYDDEGQPFTPSTNPAQAYPIIFREEIRTSPDGRNDFIKRPPIRWGAAKYWPDGRSDWHFGPTPLIAAMRCYVASKLGDEVDVPEGLVQ